MPEYCYFPISFKGFSSRCFKYCIYSLVIRLPAGILIVNNSFTLQFLPMTTESTESREGILKSLSKPIHIVGLIVLAVEGLLTYLITKAAAQDVRFYICLMVGVLILTLLLYFVLEFKKHNLKNAMLVPKPGNAERDDHKKFRYDVFLAAPMAALGNDTIESVLAATNEIKRLLEVECGFTNVFYAGSNMKTKADFDAADVSIQSDFEALRDSKYFILLYPDKIVSSVLFEAGMALALGKPSFYFGKTESFPFLMKQANQRFSHVKIQDADSYEAIAQLLRRNKRKLFDLVDVSAKQKDVYAEPSVG